ncbi:hypothetical protein RQP46_010882 [Phenoliferia psychrophenolica]
MADLQLEPELAFLSLQSDDSDEAHGERESQPTTNTTPSLPPELVSDIIELTVDLLVEEERYLPSQIPLTNRFLLSAALVDRTWHSIATSALLENGLVRPGSVRGFLHQLKKYGRKNKLSRVRFGVGAKLIAGDSNPSVEGADDAAFKVLLDSLPKIRTLEIVGIGLRIKATLSRLPLRRIIVSNCDSEAIYNLTRALNVAASVHLDVIETQKSSVEYLESRTARLRLRIALQFMPAIRSLDIYTNQRCWDDWEFEFLGILACLRHFRLVYVDTLAGQEHCRAKLKLDRSFLAWRPNFTTSYCLPDLNHLATHLAPLHYMAVCSGERPALTSLEVIRDVKPEESLIGDKEALVMVLDIIYALPVLQELKVPACWRSDAVEDACEAKGVILTWT